MLGRSIPASSVYTRHPIEAAQNGATWADIDASLSQLSNAGLNTLILSYWGHEGETDKWCPTRLFSKSRWPGDLGNGDYTENEQVALAQRFFQRAAARKLLIAPLLEVSPANPFWAEFPDKLDNLVSRSVWLLRHFGKESNWLKMTDQNGQARRAIRLIESIHGSAVDPEKFAAGFDLAAERIRKETGYAVGFILDPTPLPGYGSHSGPNPVSLGKRASVLAVNPFNIVSQGIGKPKSQDKLTEDERLAYAEKILREWSRTGLPLIAPILPGYDARIVFPLAGIYGFNSKWRQRQRQLALKYGNAGISIDCWNGWTEGYAIPPNKEDGDVNFRWVTDTIKSYRIVRH